MFPVQAAPDCPGFCARYSTGNDTSDWTDCGPCAWGERSLASICMPCDQPILLYDWFYLLFTMLLPLMLHCFFVHIKRPKNATFSEEVLEMLCCGLECLVAGIATIFLFPPIGSPELYGCQKAGIKDWYPTIFNPVINYVKPLRCSYEVVFPLYSLPFVFLLCLLVTVVVFRSLLYIFVLKRRREGRAFYYALLTLPNVAATYSLLAGILYTTFPFILIIWSLGANAIHLAIQGRAPIVVMFKQIISSPVNIAIMVVNMTLLAFAIISLIAPTGSILGYFLLLIVPVPPLFFILTIGFTHPSTLCEL